MMLPGGAAAAGADFGHAAGHAAGDAGLVFLCVYLWRHCVCDSDEVIPESHEHGYRRHTTFTLIGGILSVMLLDLML